MNTGSSNTTFVGQDSVLSNALQQSNQSLQQQSQSQQTPQMMSNSPDLQSQQQQLLQQQLLQQQLLRQQLLMQGQNQDQINQQRQLLMRQAMVNQMNAGIPNSMVQLTPQQQLLLRQQKQQQMAIQNQQLNQQLMAMSSQQQQMAGQNQSPFLQAQNNQTGLPQMIEVTPQERLEVIGRLAQAAMLALPPQQQTEERANNLGMKLEEHIFGKATSRENYFHIVETQILWQKSTGQQQNLSSSGNTQSQSLNNSGTNLNGESSNNLFLDSFSENNVSDPTKQNSSNELTQTLRDNQSSHQNAASPSGQMANNDPSDGLDSSASHNRQQTGQDLQSDVANAMMNNQMNSGIGQYTPLNLPDSDKKLVIQSLQQIRPLYTKIDVVVKMLYQFGGEREAENIRKLTSMKQILATQLEVVGRGVFLVLPDQLSKLHATLLRFFQYADQMAKQQQTQQLMGAIQPQAANNMNSASNPLTQSGSSPRPAAGQPASGGSPPSGTQATVGTPIPTPSAVAASPSMAANIPNMSPNVRPNTPMAAAGSPQIIPGVVGSPQITAQSVNGSNPLVIQFQNLQLYIQQIQNQLIQLQQIRPANAEQLLTMQRQHSFLQSKQLQAQQQASLIQMQLRATVRPVRPALPVQQQMSPLNANALMNQQLINQMNQQRLMSLTPQQRQQLLLQHQQQQQMLLLQQQQQKQQNQTLQSQEVQQLLLNQNPTSVNTDPNVLAMNSDGSATSPTPPSSNAGAKKAPRKRKTKEKEKGSPKMTPKSPSSNAPLTPSMLSAQSPQPTPSLPSATPMPPHTETKPSLSPIGELETLFDAQKSPKLTDAQPEKETDAQNINEQQQQVLLQQEIQRQMFLTSTSTSKPDFTTSNSDALVVNDDSTTAQAGLSTIPEPETVSDKPSQVITNEWDIFDQNSNVVVNVEKTPVDTAKEDESIAMFFNLDYESPPASPPKTNASVAIASSSTPAKSPMKRDRDESEVADDDDDDDSRRTRLKTANYLSTPADETSLGKGSTIMESTNLFSMDNLPSSMSKEIEQIVSLHKLELNVLNPDPSSDKDVDSFLAGDFFEGIASDRAELQFLCKLPRIHFSLQLSSKSGYEKFCTEIEGTNREGIFSGIDSFRILDHALDVNVVASINEKVASMGVGSDSCEESLAHIVHAIMAEVSQALD